jgi:Ca2+:H+ antiporter
MDLAIAITLGSCMQIALCLIPFLVILGWILDVPLGLSEYAIDFIVNCTDFEIFQGMVLFVSVTFTEYLINNGNSNWMEGSLLLGVYAIVAISYLFYPDLNI